MFAQIVKNSFFLASLFKTLLCLKPILCFLFFQTTGVLIRKLFISLGFVLSYEVVSPCAQRSLSGCICRISDLLVKLSQSVDVMGSYAPVRF